MSKCSQCNKVVTKKSPGLECLKCSVLVHAKAECAGLSAKQFAALKAAENLEWTCNSCARDPKRKSSFVTAEDDDDEQESNTTGEIVTLNAEKFMKNVTKEMKKILKEELGDLNSSVEFLSDKVDECLDTIRLLEERMKALERKNIDLGNKNKNLENRVIALEQRLNEQEQENNNTTLEIVGVPYKKSEDIEKIVASIAKKIKACPQQMQQAIRLNGRNNKDGVIRVELQGRKAKADWITLARQQQVIVSDIYDDVEKGMERIYIREALTYYYKNLLWKTKEALKNVYKFVWFKDGKILARKCENAKVFTIRCENDIDKVKNLQITV